VHVRSESSTRSKGATIALRTSYGYRPKVVPRDHCLFKRGMWNVERGREEDLLEHGMWNVESWFHLRRRRAAGLIEAAVFARRSFVCGSSLTPTPLPSGEGERSALRANRTVGGSSRKHGITVRRSAQLLHTLKMVRTPIQQLSGSHRQFSPRGSGME